MPRGLIAVVFALREELKPILKESRVLTEILEKPAVLSKAEFRGVPVVFCRSGVGIHLAHESTERLLQHFPPSLILSAGFAGGTRASLTSGTMILPKEIRSETPSDHFPTDEKARAVLEMLCREENLPLATGPLVSLWKMASSEEKGKWGREGADAVDRESAAIAAVAAKAEIPFVALRTIFDPVEETLPLRQVEGNPGGSLEILLKNPRALLKVPKFFRMNQVCQKNLNRVLGRFLDSYQP